VAGINWNEIFSGRKKALQELPNILRLPTVRDRSEILRRLVKDGDSLLDMGAHVRGLEGFFSGEKKGVKYFSFDVDRTLKHDYYSLDEIDRTFDVVTVFEVVEHLAPAMVVEFLKKASSSLNDNGLIVISTPNVCHPVVFWRDFTHITPVRYDELSGLLLSAGFSDVKIYRSGSFRLRDRFFALVFRPLIRLLRMDWFPGIIATARRRGKR